MSLHPRNSSPPSCEQRSPGPQEKCGGRIDHRAQPGANAPGTSGLPRNFQKIAAHQDRRPCARASTADRPRPGTRRRSRASRRASRPPETAVASSAMDRSSTSPRSPTNNRSRPSISKCGSCGGVEEPLLQCCLTGRRDRVSLPRACSTEGSSQTGSPSKFDEALLLPIQMSFRRRPHEAQRSSQLLG